MPKGRQSLRAWWPVFLTVLLVLSTAVEVSLAQAPAATVTRTTANDFGTQAKKLNGEAVVIDTAAPLAGDDTAGSLIRAKAVDPTQLTTLGSFAGEQNLAGDARQGTAAIIARGVIEGVTNSNKVLYLFGGKQGATVLGNVVGLPILADGTLGAPAILDVYAGDPPVSGGNAALGAARFGAVAVTRGRPDNSDADIFNVDDYIYIIGGYDLNGDPLTSIEIVDIRKDGYIGGIAPSGVSAPVGGDVAAVIIGQYLYVFGGSTTPRASDETVSGVCARALIGPDGSLGAFDDAAVPDLPTTPEGGVGLAGSRAVVTWASEAPSGDPLRYHGSANIYLIGGNQGVKNSGASNRLFKLSIDEDDTVGTWAVIDSAVSQMTRRRELFGAGVANGYLWVVGGFNLDNAGTTIWRTVEYAPIDALGDVGAFTEIDGDLTNINTTKGAGDFVLLPDNNKLIVPGGADADGVRPEIWTLDLSSKLLATPVADGAFLEGIVDFGADSQFYRLTMDIDYGAGDPVKIYFRFRSALAADTAYGTWSEWVDIKDLPLDPLDPGAGTVNRLHLLNLMYSNNTTNACLGEVIPNPSGVDGPVTARWFEYETVIVGGDADVRFNALMINGSAFFFATPAGYSPFNSGADNLPCAPNYAQGDVNVLAANDPTNPPNDVSVVRNREVKVYGVGMPTVVAAGEFDFVPLDGAPDLVTVNAAAVATVGSFQELTLEIETADDSGGPYEYELQATGGNWVGTITLSPALKLWPKVVVGPDVAPATLVSLDVDLETAGNQNVLKRQDPADDPYIIGIFGTGFRPGRVDDTEMTNGEAVDDPSSTTLWGNPANPDGRYVAPLRVEIVDTTNGDLTQAIADVGVLTTDPLAVGFVSSTQFNVTMSVPATAATGAHELTIYVYNPMDLGSIGSAATVTVYVVPDFDVDTVTTQANTVSPTLVGTDNPAEVNQGDTAAGADDLSIRVQCVVDEWNNDFRDSSGNELVSNVDVRDGAGNETTAIINETLLALTADDFFDFEIEVDANAQAGLYKILFDWEYQPAVTEAAGTLNPFPPDTIVEHWESDISVTEPQAIKVRPGPPSITSIIGSFGMANPPVLMQGDPKLVVNGANFATGAYPNWYCEVTEVAIESDAGGAAITAPNVTWTCASDNQLIVNVDVPPDQKPGQIYALKIVTPFVTPPATAIWYPEDPADVTNLYNNPNALIVITSPDITCGSITRLDAACTDNLYGVQGEAAFTLRLPGTDYEYDAQLILGDGITTSCTTHENNVDINDPTQDGAALTTAGDLGNVLRCLVTVGTGSTPGNHTITVSNGVVYQYDQNYTCADTFLIVSPTPTITRVSQSLFYQPTNAQGTAQAIIDVYGTNFMPSTAVTAGYPLYGGALAGDDITIGTVVYVDSTHLQVPVTFPRNTKPGIWQISLDVPSQTTCVDPDPFVAFNIEVKPTPEIGADSIDPNAYGLGDPDTLITITGNGLAGITGAVLANGGESITLTGVVATPTQVTGTLPQQAFATFNYNALGPFWDLTLSDGVAETNVLDQFTIYANTTIGGEVPVSGDTEVCQGETGEIVVNGTNFLPNLSPANIDLGNGISINRLLVTATQLTIGYSASADLISLGNHTLTITNPAPDQQVISQPEALAVTSSPKIDFLSPSIMGRGTVRILTIHGENFLPGATVTFNPSTGLTLGAVTVTPTTLTLSVTVAAGAEVGMRDVIVTNPDEGACSVATASRALEISICEKPVSIDNVTPEILGQNVQKNFTITGQNFHPDATVTVSNPNVTVVSYTVWSETHISVLLNASSTATVGPFDISVTNPGGGNCGTGYRTGAINLVICETPAEITNVFPVIIGQGVSKQFTITGGNFRPGASVTVTPSTGLVLVVNSITQDQILVTVTAAADAPVGPKTFTVTNPVLDVTEMDICRVAVANQPFFVQICETPVQITEITPQLIGQGITKQFTIFGSNFKPGAVVTIDPATGLTITSTDVITDTQIQVTVTAAADAPVGPKTFIVTNPGTDAANCRTARANQTFQVAICETPVQITEITPQLIGQGISKQFTIFGANFKPGAVVTIDPATGLTITSTDVITDTQIRVTVTAAADAPVGPKTFIVTNPGTDPVNCRTARANQTFSVQICETPVQITEITPQLIGQGVSKQFTIFGSNFKPGAVVTIDPATGLTVTSTDVITDTQIRVTVTAAADAPVGPKTFIVTNPGTDPVNCRTARANQTFSVQICETPIQVTEISPSLIGQGITKQFTIFGSNFKPGAVVTIDPATGLTITSTDVITDTQIRVTVTASPTCPVGMKTFIVTNPGTDPVNCRTARSNQTFEVRICESPIWVTNVFPQQIVQGQTEKITITGTNFKPGATVTFVPPWDLEVTVTKITDTTIEITVEVGENATPGPRDMIVTNPGESQCDTITVAHAIVILGRPFVTRIDPPSGSQGTQHLNLTFSGTFFEEGLTLSVVSPEYGVTLTGGASTVRIYPGAGGYIGPERFVAEVNISSLAEVGPVIFRITNPNGGTLDTDESLFKVTLPNQPAAPTDLVVQIQPGGIAKLIWQDNSFDETSFFAEIQSGSAPWKRVNLTNVKRPTQYGEATGLIKNLKPGAEYAFRVRALYAKGKSQIPSDPSNEAYGVVDGKLLSGDKPTNLLVSGYDEKSSYGLYLTWTNSGAPEGKELVILRATPGKTLQPIPGAVLSPDTTSYVDSSVVSGQKYVYQVRLQNNYNSVGSKKSKAVTAP